ncbi:pyridoxamine 5'-phosphate oxidase family protein [Nonomuraea longicatena]|uniref:Pyridoxamine 5'-phosphate oxidase family protein n=1 Tax=Nonomuraea longicatena TaxID=83682 RepID=A0ABN1PM08_9ACTN
MSSKMSVSARERFLSEVHVGVLSVADVGGRAPLAVPVSYVYEPAGVIEFATGGDTRKLALLRASGRCSFLVQTEEVPFKYVCVEGPVEIEDTVPMDWYRASALRYLEPDLAERYVTATKDFVEDMVLVRVRPERWLTYDSTAEYAAL